MPNSFAQPVQWNCPHCGNTNASEIWTIIDSVEHPDLLKKVCDGNIHASLLCSECGFQLSIDAPLLIYRPNNMETPLIFSPAGDLNKSHDLQLAHRLINTLRQNLGTVCSDDWDRYILRVVKRSELSDILHDDRADAHPDLYKQITVASQQALDIDLQDWADSQQLLGEVYLERRSGDRADNIELSLKCFHNALVVNNRHSSPLQWAAIHNNVGCAYLRRVLGDRAENIEQAIDHFQMALEVWTRTLFPELWAMALTNLGDAFQRRVWGNHADNIEHNLDYCHLALEVSTRQTYPKQWAQIQHQMAEAYRLRVRGKQAKNSERAINCCKNALEVRTQQLDPDAWASTLFRLANCYSSRILGEHADNIEAAIALYHKVLEVYDHQTHPNSWIAVQGNLARAYTDRVNGNQAENTAQALFHFGQVLETSTLKVDPQLRSIGTDLAILCLKNKDWQSALMCLLPILKADRLLFEEAYLHESRQRELFQIGNVYTLAAYALAKVGRASEALETIEAGRTRLLSETLEENRRDLERLPELGYIELLQHFRQTISDMELLAQIASLTRQAPGTARDRPPDLIQRIESSKARIQTCIQEIRQIPGYESFMRPLDAGQIQALSIHSPLVYLASTPVGGFALVVTEDTIEPIWLENLTDDAMYDNLRGSHTSSRSVGYLGTYKAWRQPSIYPTTEDMQLAAAQAWRAALDNTLRWLWEVALGQVLAHLDQGCTKQAVWIPSGYLALLPLHAAWAPDTDQPTGRRYALDALTFAYAPSARSLLEAQQIANRTGAVSLLAIDDPHGSLPSSGYEVHAALDCFASYEHLEGKAANHQAVSKGLTSAGVLHFCTHGEVSWIRPQQSCLYLAAGTELTLGEMLNMRLPGARLAVLSACETGIPGTELLDEVISLPAGMLQAGVAGVVASLWAVADLSTAMLMSRFYELWCKQGLQPTEALRQAQIWLRDTTNGEKLQFYRAASNGTAVNHVPSSVADAFFRALAWEDQDARSFMNPYYWATFAYTGL